MVEDTVRERAILMVKKLIEEDKYGNIGNDWDSDFIWSMHSQLKQGYYVPSPKQMAKIEELFEQY